MSLPKLVSVVIPAFNASATLDETLRSVRSQTYRELEIIVVDDGSLDDTFTIAAKHAAVDDRVTVLCQKNRGVAAARNYGWKQARSDLIAFIDADDLWAPTKIERQLEAVMTGGDRVGLVYCWSIPIDMKSEILRTDVPRHFYEGNVFDRIIVGNFVGNGSAALLRRQALIDAGGFDPSLRAAGVEGCEDLLLYAKVAARYDFSAVPEDLVGYRRTEGAMSSNALRMLRSWAMVVDKMLAEHPARAAKLRTGLRYYFEMQIRHAVLTKRFGLIPPLVFFVLQSYPSIIVTVMLLRSPLFVAKAVRRLLRRSRRSAVTAGASRSSDPRRFLIGYVHQDE